MTDESLGMGALQQRLFHAEDKLLEIKGELRELNLSIKELNGTISNMGKPKWQVWIGASTLICVVTAAAWGLAISPISDRLKSMEIAANGFVPREVHIEKWAQIEKAIQANQNEIRRLDERSATKGDIDRLAKQFEVRSPQRK